MHAVQIMIKDGYFASTRESSLKYFEEFEPRKIVVNGWKCVLKDDKSLECNYMYSNKKDGLCNLRYKVNRGGFAKYSLKTHNSHISVLKAGFVCSKGKPVRDGILTLTIRDGKRYVYFKDLSYMAD